MRYRTFLPYLFSQPAPSNPGCRFSDEGLKAHASPHYATRFVFAVFLLLALNGCDSDVNPVLGTDQPFTLFGLFSPQLDTQRVLVFPIEEELRPLPEQMLNARFTSTDLTDQRVLVWNDSLIPQPNGEFNHMYWHPFRAEFGHDYRVVVENPAGLRTEVRVKVPPESELVLSEVDLISDVIVSIRVQGDVPNIFKVEIRYGFDYRLSGVGEKIDHWIIPQDDRTRKTDGGWLIRVNLSNDFGTIRDSIRANGPLDVSYGIELQGMQVTLVAASEDWEPPGGTFDADVLVQPGTLSNVENGFGFVGAGYRLRQNFVLPDSVLAEAGFRVE